MPHNTRNECGILVLSLLNCWFYWGPDYILRGRKAVRIIVHCSYGPKIMQAPVFYKCVRHGRIWHKECGNNINLTHYILTLQHCLIRFVPPGSNNLFIDRLHVDFTNIQICQLCKIIKIATDRYNHSQTIIPLHRTIFSQKEQPAQCTADFFQIMQQWCS